MSNYTTRRAWQNSGTLSETFYSGVFLHNEPRARTPWRIVVLTPSGEYVAASRAYRYQYEAIEYLHSVAVAVYEKGIDHE